LIEKYKKKGTVDREPGQGRKRKLTRKERQEMRKKAKKGKCVPELTRKYNQFHEEEGKSISEPTVRRGLKSTGLKYLVVEEREEFTPKQITTRLAYSKKRLHFNWRPVLFTDEKTFPVGTQQLQRDLISCF
jgi:transposase